MSGHRELLIIFMMLGSKGYKRSGWRIKTSDVPRLAVKSHWVTGVIFGNRRFYIIATPFRRNQVSRTAVECLLFEIDVSSLMLSYGQYTMQIITSSNDHIICPGQKIYQSYFPSLCSWYFREELSKYSVHLSDVSGKISVFVKLAYVPKG